MFRAEIVVDKFYVVRVGYPNEYAVYVNDCAWHTTGIDNATRIPEKQVNAEVKRILESGFSYAEPVFVEEVYNVFDVPKHDDDRSSSSRRYDVTMSYHPIYMFPRMGVEIIKLKSDYAAAQRSLNKDHKIDVEHRMIDLIKKYSAAGVHFCPRCNVYNDDKTFKTPNTFGHIMLHTRIGSSFDGYECEYCRFQNLDKIEHWG